MWAPLLAIVQAGIAALEGLQTLEQSQQQLADELHKVCPAPAPAPAHAPATALPCPALPCPALPCPALLQCHCLGHLLQSAHTSLLMYLACCMFALYNRMCVRVCVYKRAVARDVNRSVGARACVVQAEGQCRAGQLLAGLGLDISLPGIRAATPAAAKDLLTVLLTKLADTIPPLSESRSAHYFCSATLLSH